MTTLKNQETNFTSLIWIALTCVLSGGIIGASTNAINGFVSPLYFKNILGWDFQNIWSASIAQGIFEGLIYGFFFSLVFTTSIAIITKGRSSLRFAFNHLLKVIILIYICWISAGVLAMGLAALSPDFYKNAFRKVPSDFQEMLAYAWVGGSIWGGILGGLLGIILGVINIKSNWKKLTVGYLTE